ncbi:hypothetical protein [Dipodfec virus UOA04_Rod_760]|nr:hypothetical protein [Dipodfec virus UOA04_Rod_760]
MSIVDKINLIKQVLSVVLKVADVLLSCVNSILEKVGDSTNV